MRNCVEIFHHGYPIVQWCSKAIYLNGTSAIRMCAACSVYLGIQITFIISYIENENIFTCFYTVLSLHFLAALTEHNILSKAETTSTIFIHSTE